MLFIHNTLTYLPTGRQLKQTNTIIITKVFDEVLKKVLLLFVFYLRIVFLNGSRNVY